MASGAASVLLVSVVFGGAAPNPADVLTAERLVAGSTRNALSALDDLERALEPAVDHARSGAALMVEGGEPPGARLRSAAAAAEAARDEADAAERAIAELTAALRAADPSAEALPETVEAASLDAIADELRDGAEPADVFAEMRHRTTALLERLGGALAALVAGAIDDARTELDTARADHEALRSWAIASEALPLWLATTDAMIRAVESRIDAVDAEDEEAATAAIAEFARLADEAAAADRALRIAITEGARRVANPANERLAVALESVQRVRAAVQEGSGR